MTGVHQLGHNRQIYSVEGADAVIQSAQLLSRLIHCFAPKKFNICTRDVNE